MTTSDAPTPSSHLGFDQSWSKRVLVAVSAFLLVLIAACALVGASHAPAATIAALPAITIPAPDAPLGETPVDVDDQDRCDEDDSGPDEAWYRDSAVTSSGAALAHPGRGRPALTANDQRRGRVVAARLFRPPQA